ncbi:MAG: hypothetical protein RLZZ70_750 [Candidatus Parcubacteria bacterium]|jgi:hypothetical protein
MPLRVHLKLILKKILPISLFSLLVKIWRLTFSHFFNSDIHTLYTKQYINQHGYTVTGGPFTPMNYVEDSAGSTYLLKLIGCYEAVLHPTIAKIKQRSFDTVIDIGCAEGYYLVGFGAQFPTATLIGYDIDTRALTLTKELSTRNHLLNTLILDTDCTHTKLQSQITDSTLLICDAEGFEATILNPELCPRLTAVDTYLIETHEFAAKGVVALLKNRLSATHDIEVITFRIADPSPYPFLMSIKNKNHLYQLLRERGEQEQQWIVAHKKS